MRENLAS